MAAPSSTTSTIIAMRDAALLRRDPHRAIVSLNNTAVALLQRGCCREAMETFEDVIQLMECTATIVDRHNSNNRSNGPFHGAEEVSPETVRGALERSHQRTKHRSSSSSGNVPFLCFSSSEQQDMARSLRWPILHVISSQDSASLLCETLKNSLEDSMYVEFPMTIDPIDFDTSTDEDIYFNASVVWYNYGIAHNCFLAMTEITSSSSHSSNMSTSSPAQRVSAFRDAVQTKAFGLFQWSEAVLAKVDTMTIIVRGGESEDCYSYWGSQLLLLKIALTNNLVNASFHLSRFDDYQDYRYYMRHWLHKVAMQQSFFPTRDDLIAAAA